MPQSNVTHACIALMTLLTVSSTGCSALRPPRQAGTEELHGSAVAKAMLASSIALSPPISPVVAQELTASEDDGLAEKLLEGRSDQPVSDSSLDIHAMAVDESAVVEADDPEIVALEKTAREDQDAKASAKAKARADEQKRRESEAERARSEAEAKATAAKVETAKREVARAETAKQRARARARGPFLGAGPTERKTSRPPPCTCDVGDPLCACL